jgi:hypothetical protein
MHDRYRPKISVLQTWRLGDRHTTPLDRWYDSQGYHVDIVDDAAFGNPSNYFHCITPRPASLVRSFKQNKERECVYSYIPRLLQVFTKEAVSRMRSDALNSYILCPFVRWAMLRMRKKSLTYSDRAMMQEKHSKNDSA